MRIYTVDDTPITAIMKHVTISHMTRFACLSRRRHIMSSKQGSQRERIPVPAGGRSWRLVSRVRGWQPHLSSARIRASSTSPWSIVRSKRSRREATSREWGKPHSGRSHADTSDENLTIRPLASPASCDRIYGRSFASRPVPVGTYFAVLGKEPAFIFLDYFQYLLIKFHHPLNCHLLSYKKAKYPIYAPQPSTWWSITLYWHSYRYCRCHDRSLTQSLSYIQIPRLLALRYLYSIWYE